MYNYNKLFIKLNEKGLKKSALSSELNISSKTIAKLSKGEKIRETILDKIATFLSCNREDLFEIVSSNELLQRLRDEKEIKLSGGLYHELMVSLTFNSNHIEGSTLTYEMTRMIYDTNTIISDDVINVNDVIETSNHFEAINYVLDAAEDELSEEMIKHIHYILKEGTKDATYHWFKVGDYKLRPNIVGNRETTPPSEVANEIQKLLKEYNQKTSITIEDIIDFHYKFEKIHPFQDGNGRVGRLIAFKECLKNNIIPFVILDSKKLFYYRGLANYESEKGYLIDTCLDGQDYFKKMIDKYS